jgi:superfamily II DNA or RNA helicase
MENYKYIAFKDNQIIETGVFIVNLDENSITLSASDKQVKVLNLLLESKYKMDPFLITFYCADLSYLLHFNKYDPEEKELMFKLVQSLKKIEKRKEKEIYSNEKAKKYIIKEPKNFQKEILEYAKHNNTIVFLETGLGKTYIAIMLLKEIFGEPLECNFSNRLPYPKKSEKKALFLCKTIGLLIQQAKVLKYNTNLKIFKIYGNAL